jgi:hypothetical protein
VKPKPPVPAWRWAVWWAFMFPAAFIFTILAAPLWMGLRGAAWVAEWHARRKARGVARAA